MEKTSAYEDGDPQSMVEGYDNLVRVPAYKHHHISGWFQELNDEFDGLSPRRYLCGKPWSERREIGLIALKRFGVMR